MRSKKWLKCPKCIELESYFENKTSSYAQEGTTAHELGELKIKLHFKLIKKTEYNKHIKEIKSLLDAEIFKEMDSYTEQYKEFVVERFNAMKKVDKDAEIFIEERLDYSYYAEGGFGTGDIVLVSETAIEVIDLKYGKGVRVESEYNTQLMLYGLGALLLHNLLDTVELLHLTVFQPRVDNISTFTITSEDLYEFGETVVKPKGVQALKSDGEAVPGTHCSEGFCNALPRCKAFAEMNKSIHQHDMKHPSLLTNEELVDVIYTTGSYEKWCKSVKSYVLDEMLKGKSYEGLKLVEGKSNRTFTNEEEVEKLLLDAEYTKDDFSETKLKSLTKIETLVGKENFGDMFGKLVIKPKGAPTIADVTDKRVEYNSAEDDFKDLELDN